MPTWVVTGLVAALPVVFWAISVQLQSAFAQILKALQVSVSSRDDAVISRILNGALDRQARLVVQGLAVPAGIDQSFILPAAASAFIRFCEEELGIYFSADDVYVEFVKAGSGKAKSTAVVQLSPAMAEALLDAAQSVRSGVTIAPAAGASLPADEQDGGAADSAAALAAPKARGRTARRGGKKAASTPSPSPDRAASPSPRPFSVAPSKRGRRPSPPALAAGWVALVMLAAAALDGKVPSLDRAAAVLGLGGGGADGAHPPAPYTMRDWRNMRRVCNLIRAGNFTQTAVLEGLVHPTMCRAIIDAAEDFAAARGGWTTDRHKHYPTTDLDTKYVPALAFPVRNMVHRLIIPKMGSVFGINPLLLGINEVFIAKYTAVEGQQRALDAHRDGSDFSFVVALNEGYEGGGTHFVGSNEVLKAAAGDVVTFCGQNKHEGLPVTAGTRYILAGFLSFGEPGGCEDLFDRDEDEERERQRDREMEEGQTGSGGEEEEEEEEEEEGGAAAAPEAPEDAEEAKDRELLASVRDNFERGEMKEWEKEVAAGGGAQEEEDSGDEDDDEE